MDKTEIKKCTFCPVNCGADRTERTGYCGVNGIKIAKYSLHPYEEPCISFKNGSGTIFFTGCNLQCVFCQNYSLSRAERGKEITPNELADVFKELEDRGAENISLVTPTHLVPYLLPAFEIYKPKIPVVYNCGGYEKTETLALIDEYVDIWLPDLKFYSPFLSKRYTGKEDYFSVASKAIEFMAKKPLVMTKDGKMLSGLVVRHMVMPLGVNDSVALVKWYAKEIGNDAYLSLMSQYVPYGDANKYPELARPVTKREYETVVETALSLGIEKVYIQKRSSSSERYIPDWDY